MLVVGLLLTGCSTTTLQYPLPDGRVLSATNTRLFYEVDGLTIEVPLEDGRTARLSLAKSSPASEALREAIPIFNTGLEAGKVIAGAVLAR